MGLDMTSSRMDFLPNDSRAQLSFSMDEPKKRILSYLLPSFLDNIGDIDDYRLHLFCPVGVPRLYTIFLNKLFLWSKVTNIRKARLHFIFQFSTNSVWAKESRLERNTNFHVGVKLEIGEPFYT